MNYLFPALVLLIATNVQTLFDFRVDSDISQWKVVVDGVMGGKSSGKFFLNGDGHGQFEGEISLANNGGFCLVRYVIPEKISIKDYKIVSIRVKGDEKNYQFRVKNDSQNYYSYISEFSTSGDWQEIEIPLRDMLPYFRGRKLDKPNFNHDFIEEIAILIGNKKNEDFRLLIDSIELK